MRLSKGAPPSWWQGKVRGHWVPGEEIAEWSSDLHQRRLIPVIEHEVQGFLRIAAREDLDFGSGGRHRRLGHRQLEALPKPSQERVPKRNTGMDDTPLTKGTLGDGHFSGKPAAGVMSPHDDILGMHFQHLGIGSLQAGIFSIQEERRSINPL